MTDAGFPDVVSDSEEEVASLPGLSLSQSLESGGCGDGQTLGKKHMKEVLLSTAPPLTSPNTKIHTCRSFLCKTVSACIKPMHNVAYASPPMCFTSSPGHLWCLLGCKVYQ